MEQSKSKKKLEFPPAVPLLFFILIFAVILTYIIPAGTFQTGENTDGLSAITFDSYHYVDRTPISFLDLPIIIIKAFVSNAGLLIAFFMVGGAVDIIVRTGALQAFVAWMLRVLHNNRFVTMLIFMCTFVVLSFNVAPRYMISFVPFFVALAYSLGYDALTGVSIVLLSGAMSYSTSPQGLMTITAQSYVDVPVLSGIGFRYISLCVLFIITFIYVFNYAEKVRLKKRKSLMADCDSFDIKEMPDIDLTTEFTARHKLIIAVYFIGLLYCAYRGAKGSFTTAEMSALFMVIGIAAAAINKVKPYDIPDLFIECSKRFVAPAVLVAISTAIASVMESGQILDTIIYWSVRSMTLMPKFLYAPAMFIIQLIINCFIVSGAGQAAVTMPLMGPIAEFVGLPLQTSVLAFNFGDGLGDFVIPQSSVLITFLMAANIPYQIWWKYIKKLFLIWVLVSCVLMFLSQSPMVWG